VLLRYRAHRRTTMSHANVKPTAGPGAPHAATADAAANAPRGIAVSERRIRLTRPVSEPRAVAAAGRRGRGRHGAPRDGRTSRASPPRARPPARRAAACDRRGDRHRDRKRESWRVSESARRRCPAGDATRDSGEARTDRGAKGLGNIGAVRQDGRCNARATANPKNRVPLSRDGIPHGRVRCAIRPDAARTADGPGHASPNGARVSFVVLWSAQSPA